MPSIADLLSELDRVRMDILGAIRDSKINPSQVQLSSLSDLSRYLGLITAGEFRSGNAKRPGDGFSGIRVGYPPFSYNSELWNLAGVENDTLNFGVRASDGVALAGGGAIRMTSSGLLVYNSSTNTGAIESDGDVFLGSDISAAATTSFIVFANAQTYNSESVGAGDVLIGDNSSGKPNLFWDKSAGELQFRLGTTVMNKLSSGSMRFLTAGVSRVSTAQSISDVTNTNVQFDTENRDDAGYVDLVSDNTKITIPTGLGGDYLVNLIAIWAASGGGTGYRHAIAYINGSAAYGDSRNIASTGGITIETGTFFYPLAAGDYVQLEVYQNSGGNLDLTAAGLQLVKMS